MERKRYLDLAKGIGIILVVWAHANGPGSSFIYQFHMPFFFFISGLLFDFSKKESVSQFVVKKMKSLYIPFVVWNIVVYFIEYSLKILYEKHNFEIKSYLNVFFQIEVGVNKAFFLGATWFVASLFWISVMTKLFFSCFGENKKVVQQLFLVSCISSILAFNITLPYFLSRTIICSLFYISGVIVGQDIERFQSVIDKTSNSILLAILFICIGKYNTVNMGQNLYTNKILFLLGAYCATISLLGISKRLDGMNFIRLKKVLSDLGMNTMPIIYGQFIAFVPITCIQLYLSKQKDFFSIVLYRHTYNTQDGWWMIYCLAGIGLPIIFNHMLKNIRLIKILKRHMEIK